MIDLQTALKARIPFIGIHTDDPVHVKLVLQSYSDKKLMTLPRASEATVGAMYFYWTESLDAITTAMYSRLKDGEASCIVINPDKPSMLMFDVGILQTPAKFFVDYLTPFVEQENIPALVQVLHGLSLKTGQDVIQLTMARTGSIAPKDVRKTRQMLGGEHPGLSTLDTDYDFYEWPKPIKDWLDLNDKYFLDDKTPAQLVPRGLLLAGDPGVGKTMAAMAIAKHWDIPLLRLDVPTSLNRWLGESESRIARNLSLIDASAPCVYLLDETEKIFGTKGDEGTSQRILSQILWWLQSHKSKVVTIMTTNNLPELPKELYRPERIDQVIHIERLPISVAKQFAVKVYESVLGIPITMRRQKWLRDALDKTEQSKFAHADVRVLVYDAIKTNGWLKGDEQ